MGKPIAPSTEKRFIQWITLSFFRTTGLRSLYGNHPISKRKRQSQTLPGSYSVALQVFLCDRSDHLNKFSDISDDRFEPGRLSRNQAQLGVSRDKVNYMIVSHVVFTLASKTCFTTNNSKPSQLKHLLHYLGRELSRAVLIKIFPHDLIEHGIS